MTELIFVKFDMYTREKKRTHKRTKMEKKIQPVRIKRKKFLKKKKITDPPRSQRPKITAMTFTFSHFFSCLRPTSIHSSPKYKNIIKFKKKSRLKKNLQKKKYSNYIHIFFISLSFSFILFSREWILIQVTKQRK